MKPHHYLFLCLAASLFAPGAWARGPHEISIYAAEGISTLSYRLGEGKTTPGIGQQFGFGYTYFFAPQLAISTGLEVAFYNTEAKLSSLSGQYRAEDSERKPFDFSYALGKYSEQQRATLLNVPVMAQFHTEIFYAALGAKVGVPMRATYEAASVGNLVTEGYYPQYHVPLPTPETQGLGTFDPVEHSGSLRFKTAFMLAAEAGIKWKLSSWVLYTGVFFDYGLNNLLDYKTQDVNPVQYSNPNPANFAYHSLLASQYTGGDAKPFANKLVPLAAGIKVRLAFDILASRERSQQLAKQTEQEEKDRIAQLAEQTAQDEEHIVQLAELIVREKEIRRLQTLLDQQEEERDQRIAEREIQEEEDRKEKAKQEAMLMHSRITGYALSETELLPEAKEELDKVIVVLKQNPGMQFLIEGYTCDIGTHRVNIHIGQERADAAKTYMVEHGIAAERISTISKAETSPWTPNSDEEHRLQNRRIETTITHRQAMITNN